MSDSPYRLPRSVTPFRYALEVTPELEARTFTGRVVAEVTVHAPVREIVLNAAELELSEPEVRAADGTAVHVTELRIEAETERVRLILDRDLAVGPATVALSFAGGLNPRLVGFYASTYIDAAGRQRVIGTTHFESTDARRAFPCWDEPDLKAVWAVTLVVDEADLAVANTREIGREPAGPGKVRIRFADSMVMSSYLVAYVVGPLEVTPPVDVDGTPLRIVHVPGKGDLTAFGLEAGAAALRFFSRYYGIGYPGDKLDMIALPDFAMGAMENLGCITYRETYLIADPASASQSELQAVAEVIAHEIAHMWFGDLVTMRWWNGIWLNEAFASLMETLAVDDWRPAWRLWDQFARSRTVAFEVDALESTRPIEYPVESPDDSQDMFDVLTYTKGQAVLRMLERHLGDGFREGIRGYLRTHAYGNTETVDLWNALGDASGAPVAEIMEPWIFHGGFPLVTARLDGDAVRLTTSRFRFGGGDAAAPWQVPLAVRIGDRTERLLVPPSGATVEGVGAASFLANAGGHAFVRIHHDEALMERLAGGIGSLATVERYQLLDDAWAAVLAGAATASSYLRFIERIDEALRDESDVSVWGTVLTGLSWCERILEGEPRALLRAIVRRVARPAFDRLGLQAEPDEAAPTRSLRGLLLSSLAVLGDDPEVAAMAREEELRARSGERVDPDVAAAAVAAVAARGGGDEFAAFVARTSDARTPQEQLRYTYALADFRDGAVFARALVHADSDAVRTQDQPFLLRQAMANREHGATAWAFVRDRWDAIAARVSPGNLGRLADGVRFLTTPELEAEVQTFFAAHDIPQARLQLKQTLERQRVMARFRAKATEDLSAELLGR